MADTSNLNSAKYSFWGIFSNSLWYGIVPKLPSLINVILLPFITPYLSAWDYGIWGKISAYTSVATAFCSLGLHVHLTNSYYEYGRKFYLVWSRLYFLIHVISLICASVLCIVLWFSMRELSFAPRLAISCLSVLPAVLYPNQLLAQHLFPLKAKPRPLVLRNFIASLSGISSLYVSIVILRLGYIGFVLSAAITAAVAYVLFLSPLKKEKVSIVVSNRIRRIKRWVCIGLPLVPHTLGFALLSSSTRIVMDICNISTKDIGLFTSGVSIGNYVVIITSALASSLVPQTQQFYRKGELNKFRNLFYMDFVISFACIVGISIWAKEIYMILIRNEELFVAYSVAQIVCFSNLIYPFYHFTSTIISIQKKTYHMLWLAFVPGIICVTLNFIFLPIYGYKVAAWISVFAYWSQFMLPLFIPYLKNITNEWLGGVWKLPVFAIVSAFSIMGCIGLSERDVLVKVLFTIVFFISAVFLLIYYNKKNKR